MAGSAHNGGPRDEHGKLIRFPRGQWVPEDGIEPLNGETRTADTRSLTNGADGEDRNAFEADDFWDSGETQEFVGVSASRSADALAPTSPMGEGGSASAHAGATTQLPLEGDVDGVDSDRGLSQPLWMWVRPRLRLSTAMVAATLGLIAIVGTGAAVELSVGRTRKEEADIHARRLTAFKLPALPADVRERLDGDRELALESVSLLPETLVTKARLGD